MPVMHSNVPLVWASPVWPGLAAAPALGPGSSDPRSKFQVSWIEIIISNGNSNRFSFSSKVRIFTATATATTFLYQIAISLCLHEHQVPVLLLWLLQAEPGLPLLLLAAGHHRVLFLKRTKCIIKQLENVQNINFSLFTSYFLYFFLFSLFVAPVLPLHNFAPTEPIGSEKLALESDQAYLKKHINYLDKLLQLVNPYLLLRTAITRTTTTNYFIL